MIRRSACGLLFFLVALSIFADEFSINQARRVNGILNAIAQNRHLRQNTPVMKTVSFSQQELNAYINKIYCPKFIPEVQYFKISLYPENRVEAEADIELSEKKYPRIPAFFRSFHLKTVGDIYSREYRMRFDMETLEINGTGFSPEVLDETFGAFQSGYSVKRSLFDWFTLLPGIKKIATEYQKIIFYY